MKINWGVLGAATIAVEQVIPAMLQSEYSNVMAIASRNLKKAKSIAEQFNIPKWYDSYEALLKDDKIQAVYIPLPNHLHVEWSIKALQAEKHVLVEKPIALNAKEARKLWDEAKKYPNILLMEALMYRFHPQWIQVKQWIDDGKIGKLRTIQSSFSFYVDDANSIVNNKEFGGGSLMDVGCYSISISRFLFGNEPKSVLAAIEYDSEFQIDKLTSGILEFEEGSSSFFCATQLAENQQVQIFGTEGIIKFELPFNPPKDRPAMIWLTVQGVTTEIEFEICDQYTLQADAFSSAILEGEEAPVPFKDAINNMVVIQKMHESNTLGRRIDYNDVTFL